LDFCSKFVSIALHIRPSWTTFRRPPRTSGPALAMSFVILRGIWRDELISHDGAVLAHDWTDDLLRITKDQSDCCSFTLIPILDSRKHFTFRTSFKRATTYTNHFLMFPEIQSGLSRGVFAKRTSLTDSPRSISASSHLTELHPHAIAALLALESKPLCADCGNRAAK
jgi:hypothetical protein